MNEGMIKNIIAKVRGSKPGITQPSTYKPPVPPAHVKAAQATVDADYKARVRAGTPAARTERMKARIAAMKEEALQINEIGDTPSGLAKLKSVQARAHNTMNTWSKNPKSGYSSTPPEVKKATKTSVRASNRIHKDPTTGKPFAYAALRREDVEQIDESRGAEKLGVKEPKVTFGRGHSGQPNGEGQADVVTTHHDNGLKVKSSIGWDGDHSIDVYHNKQHVGGIFSTHGGGHGDTYEKNEKYKGGIGHKEVKAAMAAHQKHPEVQSWLIHNHEYSELEAHDYGTINGYELHPTAEKYLEQISNDDNRDYEAPYKPQTKSAAKPKSASKASTSAAYEKALAALKKKHGITEEVEQVDETNARHSFTAAQQVLTPRKKDVLNASSNNPRAKAAARKYARRVAKISGTYKPKEVIAHLKSMGEETQYIEERLKASDPTSKWISDFVHSDNPRFKGKSKKERINMALGAYYSAKKGK